MAQILHGFSCKVCSIILPEILAFGLFILVFEISAIIHLQLVAMLRGDVGGSSKGFYCSKNRRACL